MKKKIPRWLGELLEVLPVAPVTVYKSYIYTHIHTYTYTYTHKHKAHKHIHPHTHSYTHNTQTHTHTHAQKIIAQQNSFQTIVEIQRKKREKKQGLAAQRPIANWYLTLTDARYRYRYRY